MKNFLKVGFFAVALGMFVASCGSGTKTESTDSVATTTTAIDSAASVKPDTAAMAPVDSAAAAATDTTKK